MGTFAGFLGVISAAVTPVVMISVCATLIIGIGNKHQSLADRARSLAAEYRSTDRESWRRPIVRRQVRAFLRRATLSWLAHCLIYFAAAVFSGTVLSALLALQRATWGRLTIGLFVSGTSVLVVALILELIELLMAQATLRWDTSDIFSDEDH